MTRQSPKRLDEMSVAQILQAIPGTHARAWRPDDGVGPTGRTGGLIIEPALTADDIRRWRTGAATTANVGRGMAHAVRAGELQAIGLSAPVIGIHMAREEGRPDNKPYSERTVRKWLAKAKKG